jgi:PAS domain S-box-containing protein
MLDLIKNASADFDICVTIADMSDPSHKLIYVNKRFTELTGYELSEVNNKNCSFLQGRLTDPQKIEFMRKAFKENFACCVDLVNYKKNGEPFWNRLVLVPLTINEKQYYMGLQNDITFKKNREYSEKNLESVKHSEVCHKVKNPLAIVLSYQSKLNKTSDQNKRIDIQEHIKVAIRRIEDFVTNLETASEFDDWTYAVSGKTKGE